MTTITSTLTAETITATAFRAADAYYMNTMRGEDRGACGFAWVTVYPLHKGNTTLGKAERKVLTALGFRKDWTGKSYELWNPSSYGCQNIDTKEAGANAAAQLLRTHGFKAYSNSRLD